MPDVIDVTEQAEQWPIAKQLQLILYSIIKVYGKDNVLEIPNTDRVEVPDGDIRFSWVTSPTSIIVHLAEGETLEVIRKLEAEEQSDES